MNLADLQADIERARESARTVLNGRNRLAEMLSGTSGITTTEVEFPEPDIMHAYVCLFGRRGGEPVVYRLAFRNGKPEKWIGISHPWGFKPADITFLRDVEESE